MQIQRLVFSSPAPRRTQPPHFSAQFIDRSLRADAVHFTSVTCATQTPRFGTTSIDSFEQWVAQIEQELKTYEQQVPGGIPPLLKKELDPTSGPKRLKAILDILSALPPAKDSLEVITQLNLVFTMVEELAAGKVSDPTQRGETMEAGYSFLSLPQHPHASFYFYLKHIGIINHQGAIQIQKRPEGCGYEILREVDFQQRASQDPGVVIFNKAGTNGYDVWGKALTS